MHQRNSDETLYELVATLASNAAETNLALRNRGEAELSVHGPMPDVPLTDENKTYHVARASAIEAAEKIITVLRGPREVLLDISFQVRIRESYLMETLPTDSNSALRHRFLASHPALSLPRLCTAERIHHLQKDCDFYRKEHHAGYRRAGRPTRDFLRTVRRRLRRQCLPQCRIRVASHRSRP